MVKYGALKGLYEVEKTIGCGGFAKVKLATHIATGEKVAIKIMDKTKLKDDLPRVKLELRALKSLSHENICKLYQVIETETHFYIVIEYCSGGELFDHIVEKNRLTEAESRIFFRQIASAVAYIHSLGYAHRDLKPENVLLDKNQNLKLIDFGLCAKPEGGMRSPLFTSCGSPTYAAPELVMGRQYLGPEVDVWALGVLLYALLAGFLPFDDQNIDSLYKKILSGKYDEPSFMSNESKKFIKLMLQVDPKKRLTMKEILHHPWMTLGVLGPVEYGPEDFKHYDQECAAMMANYYHVEPREIWSYLKRWKYDYHTATYFLLLARKKRGVSIKMYSCGAKFPQNKAGNTPLRPKAVLQTRNMNINETATNSPSVNSPKTPTMVLFKCDDNLSNTPTTASPFVEPKRPSSIRKPQKRIRSPTFDGEESPVPSKKPTTGVCTPCTPERKKINSNNETPGSARKMFDSIEKSLNKVKNVLTPRKATSSADEPLVLSEKDLCNVSTTQCSNPEYVIGELSKGLQQKGIQCTRKGFTLRGKLEPNTLQRFGGCSFELEICYLPHLGNSNNLKSVATPTKSILRNGLHFNTPTGNSKLSMNANNYDNYRGFVGIRRKRLKGDSWCYKKVCEQVLALTNTELQLTESAV